MRTIGWEISGKGERGVKASRRVLGGNGVTPLLGAPTPQGFPPRRGVVHERGEEKAEGDQEGLGNTP